MYICQIIASRGNGGLEKHVRDLSRELVAQGHRVMVIGDASFLNSLPSEIEHFSLNMRLNRYHPWLLFQLYLCLKQNKFDLVHAQANKAASMLAVVKCFLKTSTVATLHNMKSRVRVFNRFSNVICVSHYLRNQLNHAGAEVIYNGIIVTNLEKVALHDLYNLPKNKPIICAVGRLVTAKGFDILLSAINGLDVSLILIGEGPEQASLEKQIAMLNGKTIVRLIGHHETPSAIMASSDGLIISSRREGFSYVLNEALMAEVYVLSSDVPVANEVLPKALIVPVNDVEKLRNRLQTLLHAPAYWSVLMQVPKDFSKNEMTLEKMTTNTIGLYKRIIQKAKKNDNE
jgi:glycosyltransferase involved in cell wall biosynthesis